MDIHTKIFEKINNFIMKTGKAPERIYLGEKEMSELLQWAYENQYITTAPSETVITEKNRPKVSGLPVYEVNDTSHFEVS